MGLECLVSLSFLAPQFLGDFMCIYSSSNLGMLLKFLKHKYFQGKKNKEILCFT